MKILTCPVGYIAANCYIVYKEQNKLGFLVDPGGDAEKILETISSLKIEVTHILLTHGHFDHIMAAAQLKKELHALLCIHPADQWMLASADACLLRAFTGLSEMFVPSQADILLENRTILHLAGEQVLILHTPGHSPGSVCFDTGTVLFSGDTLFAGSCGRWDLPGGDYSKLKQSLLQLAQLSGERIVYPGHGNCTSLEQERKTNPAL